MTMGIAPETERVRWTPANAALILLAGAAAAAAVTVLDGAWAAGAAALAAGGALALGLAWGNAAHARATRLRLYRVADELVQYRAFTRLLRSQNERIVGLTGDAAIVLANGLRDMDERACLLARKMEQRPEAVPFAEWQEDAIAITAPIVDMVGQLQFQDVTQQQLMFLSRLSLMLDEHMGELANSLGDRRALDRATHFKELFDRALNDTVMTSQRNDHCMAAGTELFEQDGPAIELFGAAEETK